MTCTVELSLEKTAEGSAARAGRLRLSRGHVVETPVFMPVGTQAAVRSLPPHFLEEVGAQIVLANAYHLHQRPGERIIAKLGGLQAFMGLGLPMLTDSGGFQVFSLEKRSVTEEGVSFRYAVDGKKTFLSPEGSMDIQQMLGADIAMAFDECLPAGAEHRQVADSVDRTARWAERSKAAHKREDQSLFGIVQGGMFPELRRRSAAQITGVGFDGYAVGGLAVGEARPRLLEMTELACKLLPRELPRYLMGVGRPLDLIDCVARGIDMFDCVIPTRHARSGLVYTVRGRLRLTDRRYRRDSYPPDTSCQCYTCSRFSRAYLHHLHRVGEVLGKTLCTIHNLAFFQQLMRRIREAVIEDRLPALREELSPYYERTDD